MSGRDSGVRLAELVATVSLAADLGLGQPAEHAVRSTLVALDVGEAVGQAPEERATTYWVSLLAWIGCTADSHELAKRFGDDIALRAGTYGVDLAGVAQLGFLVRRAGSGRSIAGRATEAATLVLTGGRAVEDALTAHCEVTGHLAGRFRLGPDVSESLRFVFARWDGKGLPGTGGKDIPLPARLLHLADIVVAHHRAGGVDAATAVARKRRGTQFDPDLVDAFLDRAPGLFERLESTASWDEVIAAEPGLRPTLPEDDLDHMLEVFADCADLKSPYFLTHSRGVAALAAAAAESAGHAAAEVTLVRRAGIVHDIGRAGVPNTIWDKPGPLTRAEVERVRLHDYYAHRMLARPARLAEIGAVAAAGHERIDGSGYHRGASGATVAPLARLLGAADAFHAMTEERPHRPAMPSSEAAAALRSAAREGALDPAAVDAVLRAAGERVPRPSPHVAGLTDREIEVLALLARGHSNRRIAQELGISPKTAGSHVERIYAKAGVSSRAAAALFAIQKGLLPAGATDLSSTPPSS